MYKLDKKDKKLVAELDCNSRQTYKKIGEKIKLPKETINYRIQRLEKLGIIQNYITVINPLKLGFSIYRCYIKLQNINIEKYNEIISFLKSNSNVGSLIEIRGSWDINAAIWSKNDAHFWKIWNEFREEYQPYIERTNISKITKMYNFNKKYLSENNSTFDYDTIVQDKIESIDSIDVKILSFLSNNARAKYLFIAKTLHLTERIIRARVNKMVKKKIILRYRTALDLEALGYNYYKIHLKINKYNEEIIKKLFGYALLNQNIVYITEAIGGFDYELEVQTQGTNKLYQLIDDIKQKFGTIISDYDFMEYTKEHKLNYFPL